MDYSTYVTGLKVFFLEDFVYEQFSEWLPVASGVPQGSMLGLLLYIDDIEHVVKHSSSKFFADDLSLYLQVSSFAE